MDVFWRYRLGREDHHGHRLNRRGTGSCWAAQAHQRRRRPGIAALLSLLAGHGDSAADPVPVATETPRGLLVAVPAAPPGAASTPSTRWPWPATGTGGLNRGPQVRPRRRGRPWRGILRTDCIAHGRCQPIPSWPRRIVVLARAQQDAVWDRTCAHNKLRSHLREYFPGFLAAFAEARGGITRRRSRRYPRRRPRTRLPPPGSPWPSCGRLLRRPRRSARVRRRGRRRLT